MTGGRDYDDIGHVFDCLTHLDKSFARLVVIHGGAPGTDTLCGDTCTAAGIEFVAVPAAWKKFKRAAGPIRNQLMLDLFPNIDLVLAFPGGTGTADMKKRAGKMGIDIIESRDLLVNQPTL